MKIQEAITKAKEMMEDRKKQLQLQKEKWAKIKLQQQQKDILLRESKKKLKKELLNKWHEKVDEFFNDKDNIMGIKFIEENSKYFALERGDRYALYLCSDGSFKEQGWGMYMGDNNIQKVNLDGLDIEKIERILRLNLKELVIEQILELGKPKPHQVNKITQRVFNEIFG
ncbi:hypothetical protein HZC30_02835 [Candidatus Woesearchaeota archaeon]|nr:hypothetical protein [Candidatus Woesearchaeota archaeon]